MHVSGRPSERVIGRLRVDVAVGPIARMFPAEDWQREQNAGGGAVFAGRADEVVENVDHEPGQDAGPTGLFNLDAHIHDVDSGHPVPYLEVSVSVNHEGHSVLAGLPLVPVARPHKGVAGLHYGNNVALEPAGAYEVLLSLAPTALTGTDREETLGFVIDFDRPDTPR